MKKHYATDTLIGSKIITSLDGQHVCITCFDNRFKEQIGPLTKFGVGVKHAAKALKQFGNAAIEFNGTIKDIGLITKEAK